MTPEQPNPPPPQQAKIGLGALWIDIAVASLAMALTLQVASGGVIVAGAGALAFGLSRFVRGFAGQITAGNAKLSAATALAQTHGVSGTLAVTGVLVPIPPDKGEQVVASEASLVGYELLAKELAQGNRLESLWLKAISEHAGDEPLAQAAYNRGRAAMLKAEHSELLLLREKEQAELKRAMEEAEAKDNAAQAPLISWTHWLSWNGEWRRYQPSLERLEEKQAEMAQWIQKAEADPPFKLHPEMEKAFAKLTYLRTLHAKHVAILNSCSNLTRANETQRALQSLKGVTFSDINYGPLYKLNFRKSTLPILIGVCLVVCVAVGLVVRYQIVKSQQQEQEFKAGMTVFEAKKYREALEIMGKLIGQENLAARDEFVQIYRDGAANDAELKKDIEWHRKAADLGLEEAQFALGIAYRDGIGTAIDKGKAEKWFGDAAVHWDERPLKSFNSPKGHAGARLQYGLSRLAGYNPSFGFGMIRESAEQGLPEAQFHLAKCYEMGLGVTQDLEQSIAWYQKAFSGIKSSAEQGLPEAQFYLARCYESGEGVTVDRVTALFWYRKAAEAGSLEAKQRLGIIP